MTTSGFRLDEGQFRTWHTAVAARVALRGVAAIAKEMEAHLARAAAGHVPVTRHTLFSWAESLDGAASRDPRGASAGSQLSLAQVVEDMRAVLAGREPAAPSSAPPAAGSAASRPVSYTLPGATTAAPPVQYGAPPPTMATSTGGMSGARFVAGAELQDVVRRMIREASQEVLVIAPWQTGIETLVADLVALPPHVKVRLLSRLPTQQDAAYHRAIGDLGRRGAITTFSPHLYTRMVVRDRAAVLVGAASTAPSKEAGIVLSDAAAASAAAAHFERCVQEAVSGR